VQTSKFLGHDMTVCTEWSRGHSHLGNVISQHWVILSTVLIIMMFVLMLCMWTLKFLQCWLWRWLTA